jgi:hypothetical protein
LVQVLEAPVVHPCFAALAALAVADEHRAAPWIDIGLPERECLGDSEPGTPQNGDQSSNAQAVAAVTGGTQHRDDLLDPRRVGR